MASSLSTEQILSAMEQLSPAELEKLVPRVIALGAARRAPHLEPEESKLLERINEALPVELMARLCELQEKRDTRTLSEPEEEELLTLSDRVEQLHAERLGALADLARLRGTTLTALMDRLGIGSRRMPREYFPVSVTRLVVDRARGCCEYCRSQSRFSPQSFSVEHISPRYATLPAR